MTIANQVLNNEHYAIYMEANNLAVNVRSLKSDNTNSFENYETLYTFSDGSQVCDGWCGWYIVE